jgi:predicted DNA-binding transcriptional regulator AlpA
MDKKIIPAATVRELCGGISDMSMWRWLQNADLNFPKPIYISRRRYWRQADVLAWVEAQAGSQYEVV